MKKYEELENNIYVKEVGNLVTLKEAAKMLGVSNKELKKYIITEQMVTNNIIKSMFDKLFGANIIPEIQQSYFLEILEKIPSLGYTVSVLVTAFPNLKSNPNLLFKALTEYNSDQIKHLDVIEIETNNNINPSFVYYVSGFASDYGISSKKMCAHIIEMQSKNKSVFDKMLNTLKSVNYDRKKSNDKVLKDLKKVSHLDYVVASLIYNFPNIVSDTDTFFTTIIETKNEEIERIDSEEITDKKIKEFVESKRNYFIMEKVK